LVSVEGAVCKTFTLIVINGSLLFAARTLGSVQLTVCEAIEHDHPVPEALVGVNPIGSVSFTVTIELVDPYGLTFIAVML
jgi:hypothetical protein